MPHLCHGDDRIGGAIRRVKLHAVVSGADPVLPRQFSPQRLGATHVRPMIQPRHTRAWMAAGRASISAAAVVVMRVVAMPRIWQIITNLSIARMMKTKNRNQRTAHKLLAQADELTVCVMRSRSDRQVRVEFELRG